MSPEFRQKIELEHLKRGNDRNSAFRQPRVPKKFAAGLAVLVDAAARDTQVNGMDKEGMERKARAREGKQRGKEGKGR